MKPDTILKTFWKNNQRFADLFNTVLFEGNPVLKPNDLQEVDEYSTSDEFLSALKKDDRLHPVISLCIYYGEKEWDGPFNLLDMLVIPEYLKPLVSDYRMNLIQVRQSENLCFQNQDISIVFDMIRSIYNKDYETFHEMYKDKTMSTELGLTVGSVVKSQAIINEVMKMEEKRSEVDMCDALQRWFDEAVQKGKIEGVISTCRRFHISSEETVRNLIEEFSLSKSRAEEYIKMYW